MAMKCTNCGQNAWQNRETNGWFWVRCARCGFHTSSYTTKELAINAKDNGENYASENGNKIIED